MRNDRGRRQIISHKKNQVIACYKFVFVCLPVQPLDGAHYCTLAIGSPCWGSVVARRFWAFWTDATIITCLFFVTPKRGEVTEPPRVCGVQPAKCHQPNKHEIMQIQRAKHPSSISASLLNATVAGSIVEVPCQNRSCC